MEEDNETPKINLNLGCGTDIREGFINIDAKPFEGISLKANVINLSKIRSESVDFIVAQHILQYIPRPLLNSALDGWLRILKPEGVLEVRVPDLKVILENINKPLSDPDHMNMEMATACLYGRQQDEFDVVFNAFTEEYLEGILFAHSFRITNIVREAGDIIFTAEKKSLVDIDIE